jgi:hypothetical protein
MKRFLDRPTGDILVLMLAGTICFTVLASGLAISLAAIFSDRDVSQIVSILSDTINTLIGLLAGFIAGKAGLVPPPPPDIPIPMSPSDELNRQNSE